MAVRRRLTPNKLAEVKSDFAGLRSIADYLPLKPEFTVAAIAPVEAALDELLTQEAQMVAQLGELRDLIADKSVEFVQKMKGAAQQIVAQYGDDSAEIQKVGRKRTSERAAGRPFKKS